jgi:hypothetical protein
MWWLTSTILARIRLRQVDQPGPYGESPSYKKITNQSRQDEKITEIRYEREKQHKGSSKAKQREIL